MKQLSKQCTVINFGNEAGSTPQLEQGKYYHIYNRGNNKETIFKEPANYYYFLSKWIKYIEPVAKTFCYNLLPNHFHFFIRIEELDKDSQTEFISQSFSNFFNAYAKAINGKYKRSGSLFQERFRRKAIADDAYFTTIVGYILTNAVKHGIVKMLQHIPILLTTVWYLISQPGY